MDATLAVGIVPFFAFFGMTGVVGLPLGVPPEAEDPLVSRIAPEECLYYTAWNGMATPDPQSDNSVEQMFAEPELQMFAKDLEATLTNAMRVVAAEEGAPPQAVALIDKVPGLLKKLATSPTAIYISRAQMTPDGPDVAAGMLVKAGQDVLEVKRSLVDIQTMFLGENVEQVTVRGGVFYRINGLGPGVPPITWGTKGLYLMLAIGDDEIEQIFTRAATEAPEWYTQMAEDLPVERRSTVTYSNVGEIMRLLLPMAGPEGEKVVAALGLKDVTHVTAVTGLDGDGFVSRSRIATNGQPTGVFEVISDNPLTIADVSTIPADATIAAAARADVGALVDKFIQLTGAIDPDASAEIEQGMQQAKQMLGFDIRADLLASLGDVWCVYNSPDEGGFVFSGATATVSIRDKAKLESIQTKLLAMLKSMDDPEAPPWDRPPRVKEIEFAGQTIHFAVGLDGDFPFTPSWCITDDHLVIALFPQNIKAFLTRGDDYASLADQPVVSEVLGSDAAPSAFVYQDSRELFKLAYPVLQMALRAALSEAQRDGVPLNMSLLPTAKPILDHLKPGISGIRRTEGGIESMSKQSFPSGNLIGSVPITVPLLVPAVSSARKAAQRTQSMNNLKQIGIALLSYEATHARFPTSYSVDEDGKPLLSWRVHVLPYIEAQGLYERFKLDEPWDSEHNKKLLPLMPQIYASPGANMQPGHTSYLAVVGEDTVIAPPVDKEGKKTTGSRAANIRDGSSNTIMLVEADESEMAPWTKPTDYEYDPTNPAKGLGRMRDGQFIAIFADCHIQMISRFTEPTVIRAMFTRSGGEAINPWGEEGDEPFMEEDHGHSHSSDDAVPEMKRHEGPIRIERPVERPTRRDDAVDIPTQPDLAP